MSLKSSIGSPP
jgi:hypothetical protein